MKKIYPISLYLLCGLTFKKFFDGYLGFIPIFGEMFLFRELSDLYCDYKVTKYYTISYVLSILFSSIPIFLFFIINMRHNNSIDYLSFKKILEIFTALTFIFAIFRLFYSYKILSQFANINTDIESKSIIMIFSAIPLIFYIYVLIKNIEIDYY